MHFSLFLQIFPVPFLQFINYFFICFCYFYSFKLFHFPLFLLSSFHIQPFFSPIMFFAQTAVLLHSEEHSGMYLMVPKPVDSLTVLRVKGKGLKQKVLHASCEWYASQRSAVVLLVSKEQRCQTRILRAKNAKCKSNTVCVHREMWLHYLWPRQEVGIIISTLKAVEIPWLLIFRSHFYRPKSLTPLV